MRSLYVTLGHNASAVLAVDGVVVKGYEQERIDGVKNSSAFPYDALRMLLPEGRAERVFVSHWFDEFSPTQGNKWYDPHRMRDFAEEIVSFDDMGMTHHDAHARSAMSFFDSNGGSMPTHIVVLDGFGTRQECFSAYVIEGMPHTWARPRLIARTYGYSRSLGLMYQFTTEYVGLKPNQDEYKLLGYESNILNYTTRDDLKRFESQLANDAIAHAQIMLDSDVPPSREHLQPRQPFDSQALWAAKRFWYEQCDKWQGWFEDEDVFLDQDGQRTCLAWCAQTFLEYCVMELIAQTLPANKSMSLLLAGGCFLNVKLNREIWNAFGCKVFPHPLSGDQGAAMGLDAGLWAHGLCWGERDIRDDAAPGAIVCEGDQWVGAVARLICDNRIVNLVRGPMEFGPRALCNTSTLALPFASNVHIINRLNDRDESMPMAPVMTQGAASLFLEPDELQAFGIATRYMITTMGYKQRPPQEMMGVAHKHPTRHEWTARPQIVDGEDPMHAVLSMTPDRTLINTSFNYHGEPIVMTQQQAYDTWNKQRQRAAELGLEEPALVVVRS